MMPKRVAETDPNTQITDFTGSGPFVFRKDEWKPGDRAVYVKFDKYKPRSEPPSGMAGGKVVKVDRVEWRVIADQQTAVNALIAGEIDFIEQPAHDLLPVLVKDAQRQGRGHQPARQPVRVPLQLDREAVRQPEDQAGAALRVQPGGLPEGGDRRPEVLQDLQGDVHLRHAARDHEGHRGPARVEHRQGARAAEGGAATTARRSC